MVFAIKEVDSLS